MIMASHRTFSGQNKQICLAKSNLARQICYSLSMEVSLSLLKIMNVQTNSYGPYHKHCYDNCFSTNVTFLHDC